MAVKGKCGTCGRKIFKWKPFRNNLCHELSLSHFVSCCVHQDFPFPIFSSFRSVNNNIFAQDVRWEWESDACEGRNWGRKNFSVCSFRISGSFAVKLFKLKPTRREKLLDTREHLWGLEWTFIRLSQWFSADWVSSPTACIEIQEVKQKTFVFAVFLAGEILSQWLLCAFVMVTLDSSKTHFCLFLLLLAYQMSRNFSSRGLVLSSGYFYLIFSIFLNLTLVKI